MTRPVHDKPRGAAQFLATPAGPTPVLKELGCFPHLYMVAPPWKYGLDASPVEPALTL
jgi:hypothetical protein